MTVIVNTNNRIPTPLLKMGVGDNCILIGQGILLIHCAKYLLDNGLVIANILTFDSHVKIWAQDNGIPTVDTMAALDKFVAVHPCEFLFSIVNPALIPNSVLSKIQICSINYHDSPLPFYAGTNASAWALLSGEENYAISWHMIEAKVDAGHILMQELVSISDEDTSFTLNLKCNDAALIAFQKLLDQLFDNTISVFPQNLDLRTFYPGHKRPEAACCFHWNKSAHQLQRLFKALDFGFHPNPLGMPKILIGNEFYTFSRFGINEYKSNFLPGTLIGFQEDVITITTKTNDVSIGKFKTLDGHSISIKSLVERHSLGCTSNLPQLTTTTSKLLQDLHERYAKHEVFWIETLKNRNFASQLPLVRTTTFAESALYVSLDKDSIRDLITPGQWTALVCAFIARLSSNKTVCIGFESSTLTNEIGSFANLFLTTLPFEVEIDCSKTFDTCVETVEEEMRALSAKGSYTRDIFQRYPALSKSSNQDENASWPIIIRIDEKKCLWSFNISGVDEKSIKKIIFRFETFVNSVFENRDLCLGKVPVLSPEEYNEIIFGFNKAHHQFDETLCIHELFEAQVAICPQAIALEFENEARSYVQLNQQANQFAHYLLEKGIKKGTHVALCMHRGIEFIVGFLALSKVGAVYIPIDPTYPLSRIDYLLTDSQAEWLITSHQIRNEIFVNSDTQIICYDSEKIYFSDNVVENIDKADIGLSSNDIAYIIYTSGSTGKPKGTLIAHKGLCNLALTQKDLFSVSKESRVLQFASISFDASIHEIVVTLSAGSTLVLVTKPTTQDPAKLDQVVKNKSISHITLPPVLLPHLNIMEWQGVKFLIVAGDACPIKYARQWASGRQLINGYGPTESTVCVSMGVFKPDDAILHIGKPIPNVQVYVLNEYLQPQPLGIAGELYIGGIGLAKEYFNKPEITAEKFIANPFTNVHGSRLYRSGDLVRWLDDGNLEFIGRIDNQIKIHGFRVELSEIENCLINYDDVAEAVVIAKEGIGNSKKIVAYVVPVESISSSEDFTATLKEYLLAELPEYMVPALIVPIDKLPLTANGKPDKAALSEVGVQTHTIKVSDAPLSAGEKALVDVWKNVLSLDYIDLHDDFFKLGGNSILVIFAISQLGQKGFLVTSDEMYQHKTIAALAGVIRAKADNSDVAEQSDNLILGKAPVLPNVLEIMSEWTPHHWNSSFILRVAVPYSEATLYQAIVLLLRHHDALRTLWFEEGTGNWYQYFQTPDEMHPWWTVIDLTHYADKEAVQEIERLSADAQFTLNLSKVLFKVIYFNLGDGRESRILFVLNHMLLDNFSNYIFINHFGYICDRIHHQQPVKLPPKSTSVKYVAECYEKYVHLPAFKQDHAYWLARPWNKYQALPTEALTEKLDKKHYTRIVRNKLTKEETRRLELIPQKENLSLQELLLTAMFMAYREWSGNNALVLLLTHHGRTANAYEGEDLSRTIGLLPIPATYFLELSEKISLKDAAFSLKQQKDELKGREASLLLLKHKHPSFDCRSKMQSLPDVQLKLNIFGRLPKEVVENNYGFYWTPENVGPLINPDPEGIVIKPFQPYSMTEFEYGTDCLAVQWAYSAAMYSEETMQNFLQLNMKYIRQLIDVFS